MLVALSCLAQAQASGVRAQAELWEVVYTRPRSPEAARALLELAEMSRSPLKLLRRVVADFPGTEEAFRARLWMLPRQKPQAWREAAGRLLQEAGGPPLREALARVEPWPVPAQRQAFVQDVLRGLVESQMDEDRRQEARELLRFLRVQYGSGPAGEAALYDLLERCPGDKEAPRIMGVGTQRLVIQLHDGSAQESQCDLKTLKVRLDGRDVTRQLVRRHYLDLSGSPDLPFERIELSHAPALQPGPHTVEVEIRDGAGNPAASAWKLHHYVKARDERLREAFHASDSAALELLRAQPERMWQLDHNDFPPLVGAAWAGRTETVRWLLERGAPIPAEALEMAANGGHPEAARVLLEAGAQPTPVALERAIERGDPVLTRVFLAAGVDPRSSAEELIFVAARSRNPEVTALLLPYFPDRDRRDSSGCTVLAAVVGEREPAREVIQLLLESGYDPNARDGQGRTVWQRAGGEGCPDWLQEMLSRYGGRL